MNFSVDITLAIIGIVLVIVSTVRGFVKSFMGFARLGLALMTAYVVTPLLSFWQVNILLKYLTVFVVAFALLVLLTFLIDKLCQKPVLKELNRVFGLFFGIASAYIVMSILTTLITGLFVYETFANAFGMTRAELEAQTFVYRFFNNYGVFAFIKLPI